MKNFPFWPIIHFPTEFLALFLMHWPIMELENCVEKNQLQSWFWWMTINIFVHEMRCETNILTKYGHINQFSYSLSHWKKIRPFEKSPTDGYSDYLIYAIFDIDISPAWMVCIDNKLLSWKFAVWRWRCIRFDWFVYNLQDDNNGKKSLIENCNLIVPLPPICICANYSFFSALIGWLPDWFHTQFFCWS